MSLASKNVRRQNLKKHIAAIHSANKLSLVQRKIADALLYNAYDSLLEKEEHHIHIETLAKLIGYNSKDFKKIREDLIRLISTVIEWNLIDGDKMDSQGIWNASSIIADARIDGPICSYSYSLRMRELLYRPEFYGTLNMEVMSQFKSVYGLVLYQNCIRYQNIKHTAKIPYNIFRQLMGVDETQYLRFSDFKKRVLNKGIEEVNKYSPIKIKDVVVEKVRKKVKSLQFLITKKELMVNGKTLDYEHDDLISKLKNKFGFNDLQTTQIILDYEKKYILEKIEIVESSSAFNNGKILNLTRYLGKALEENYKKPISSAERMLEIRKEEERAEKTEKRRESYRDKYRYFVNEKIYDFFEKLENKKKKKLIKTFAKFIDNTVYGSLYQKSGLDNVLVRDRFSDYIRANHKSFMQNVATLDEFISLKEGENLK